MMKAFVFLLLALVGSLNASEDRQYRLLSMDVYCQMNPLDKMCFFPVEKQEDDLKQTRIIDLNLYCKMNPSVPMCFFPVDMKRDDPRLTTRVLSMDIYCRMNPSAPGCFFPLDLKRSEAMKVRDLTKRIYCDQYSLHPICSGFFLQKKDEAESTEMSRDLKCPTGIDKCFPGKRAETASQEQELRDITKRIYCDAFSTLPLCKNFVDPILYKRDTTESTQKSKRVYCHAGSTDPICMFPYGFKRGASKKLRDLTKRVYCDFYSTSPLCKNFITDLPVIYKKDTTESTQKSKRVYCHAGSTDPICMFPYGFKRGASKELRDLAKRVYCDYYSTAPICQNFITDFPVLYKKRDASMSKRVFCHAGSTNPICLFPDGFKREVSKELRDLAKRVYCGTFSTSPLCINFPIEPIFKKRDSSRSRRVYCHSGSTDPMCVAYNFIHSGQMETLG